MPRLICGILTLICVLLSLAGTTFSVRGQTSIVTNETVLFEDNFEEYNLGTFPSSGGWELWFNGAGNECQTIIGAAFVSP